eukprot:NODE_2363_length_1602_cov_43.841109_g2031_i0.p1 GENE.NODE_2363_length_1602_cov_43.841109_g2031_i0~~NODE_2363_length_1602_cov_43.841109_g2031_i0.p1  ORF type:complete len:509 (-),score=107.65 NODE_2363_length_1602_cov_43.841109_g2031_i0:74-1534(-)
MDSSGWLSIVKILLTLIGLLLIVLILNSKSLFSVYKLSSNDNAMTLRQSYKGDVQPGYILDAFNTSNGSCIPITSCPLPYTLSGTGGNLCRHFEPNEMLTNLSRWNNLRAALYALYLFEQVIIFILIIRVKYARGDSDPYQYGESTLKTLIDAIQFCIGSVVLLFVGLEMGQFWHVIDFYTSKSSGSLKDFWVAYEQEYYISMVAVLIFLCFGVALFLLRIVMYIPCLIFSRMCVGFTPSAMMPPTVQGNDLGHLGYPQPQMPSCNCCNTSNCEWVDWFLTALTFFGLRGTMLEYVVKGTVPESTSFGSMGKPKSRMDWLNQPLPQALPTHKAHFDLEHPDERRNSLGARPPQSQEMESKRRNSSDDEDEEKKKKKHKKHSSHKSSEKKHHEDGSDHKKKKKKKEKSDAEPEKSGRSEPEEGGDKKESKRKKKHKKPKDDEPESGSAQEGEKKKKKKKKKKKSNSDDDSERKKKKREKRKKKTDED